MKGESIVILDNGGQFTHLIANSLRRFSQVRTEIRVADTPAEELEEYGGIILSGSPYSIYEEDSPQVDNKIFNLPVPILGLCYGMHQIALHYGGKVKRTGRKEYGYARLKVRTRDPIFKGLPRSQRVWMSHGDSVTSLPEGFRVIGSTSGCPIAAFSDPVRRRWGLQFHPEVEDTRWGDDILFNFARVICGLEGRWTVENFTDMILKNIREEVGEKEVLSLVSGGVDSTVVAALLLRALPPEKVYSIHINTGLMRKNESEEVIVALKALGIKNLIYRDRSDLFLKRLEGVHDPEEKRKIIGELFVELVEEEARRLNLEDWLLAQGTLYPDTIESGATKYSDVIKTHHNRVNIILRMIEEGRVIEPVHELYKAEVREVGRALGLPEEIVERHPFPGPGLGIRYLCLSEEKAEEYWREAHRAEEGIREGGRVEDIFDSHKVRLKGYRVLPIKSVGVKGDARSYDLPLAVWIEDAPTVRMQRRMKLAATEITGVLPEINRVVLILSPDEIGEPENYPVYIKRERVELLRELDWVVTENLKSMNLYRRIWQFPTIITPVRIGESDPLIVLRPIKSKRAMTAESYPLPLRFLKKVLKSFERVGGRIAVGLDLTSKPPGTIEWE